MSSGRRARVRGVLAATAACAVLLSVAASASAANRFAEVGGDGSEPCLSSDPCSLEDAVNDASTATSDDVTLLGGLLPAPYVTSTPLVVPSNVTVHGSVGARPVIQASGNGVDPAIKLNTGSVLRDVVVDFSGSNLPAVQLVDGGTLERVTARATGGTSPGGCGTLGGGTPVIRDSVCWHDGAPSANVDGALTARNSFGFAQTLTLRNVTAISSDANSYAGIAAFNVGGGLTINATNVIAFSENGTDVEYLAGFTPTAINFDHSNYDTEGDTNNVITNPGTGTGNQTTTPVFADRLGGDFHQLPTSTGTIDLGTATGVLMDELDFEGQERSIGANPDIGADELGHLTSTSIDCIPASLTLGAGGSGCTATVTDTVGALLPAGDVGFSSGGSGSFSPGGACTLAFVSDSVGSCELTYTPSATGSHPISGSYPGDSTHEASQGSTTIAVAAPSGGGATGNPPSTPPSGRAAAIKKCKKKFPKGPKRKKCIKKAKKRFPV